MLLDADRSVLIVIDVQERLFPAMHEGAQFLRNTEILMQAADRLGVPMIVTEQYPDGIGPTIAPVAALASPGSVVEKITFSATGSDAFERRLAELEREEPVVCGIEAHVCVLQTALSLRERGSKIWMVRDAITSRRPESAEAGRERAAEAGIGLVTAEMVVFEWLRRADTPVFRELLALIK